METEARMSREAWVRATDASDLVHGEVMSLRTTVLSQMSEIRELQATDRRRQTVILELLRIDHKKSTEITELRTALQGQVTALQGQVTALQAQVTTLQGQQGLAGDHTQPELPEEAGGIMKMMTKKYYPRNEIMKLEMELWDLKVKGTNLPSYTQRYQELALLCGRIFSEESDKIEKYIGGLPDMIHGSVVASKPKTMKFENTSRNTQNQQQQQHSNKRQNTGRVYTASSGEKKQYGGSKPLCTKCNYHHDGPCAPKCRNCNKISHFARDCRSAANTNSANNQRGTVSGQKSACYECGVQGNFKRECPKLKNNSNHGNHLKEQCSG
nr:hypothetical protein [Tanacetum cinerariifolium]